MANLAFMVAGLKVLPLSCHVGQRVVRTVADRLPDFLFTKQRGYELRYLREVQKRPPTVARACDETQTSLCSDRAERNAGEEPEGCAPVAHPREVLNERTVHPFLAPRRLDVRPATESIGKPKACYPKRIRDMRLIKPGNEVSAQVIQTWWLRSIVTPYAERGNRQQRRSQHEETGMPVAA